MKVQPLHRHWLPWKHRIMVSPVNRSSEGSANAGISPSGGVSPLTGDDTFSMACGLGLTLLISYLLGFRRIFWEDEMLGWMLLRDPTWHHMLHAWKMGADGGGFTFYLTGRMWFWIFGASEISFRMYSAVGFGLAFCVLWVTLRRFYARDTVAFALFNTWFFSQTIVTHTAEGRFYGLLMLFTVFAVYLVVEASRTGRTAPWLYAASFVVHAALVTSHLLGVVYSATVLGALIFLDLSSGRFRSWLYATIVSTWLFLLAERAAIIATAQVGQPHFWTTQPNLSRWVGAYSAYSAEVAVVLVLLCAAALFTMQRKPGGWRRSLQQAFKSRRSAYVVTMALLLIPVEFFIEGLVGPPLFINRYLMPVAIAQCFLTAEAIQLTQWKAVLGGLAERTWLRRLAAAGFLAAILLWDVGHLARAVMPRRNYTDELTVRLPKGLPVLCEDAWAFTELIGRQHASGVRYVYLLDWAQSTSVAAPRLEVTQFHLMENWKKVGYFAGSIEYRDHFLENNPRFLIFHQKPGPGATYPPFIGDPLVERFKSDPQYQVIPYGPASGSHDQDLWLVCRDTCRS
jgi:hypothetical protein